MGKKKAKVTVLLNTGLFYTCQVAQKVNISVGSVSNIRRSLSNGAGHYKRKEGSGSRKKTNDQDDRLMMRLIKERPVTSAPQIKKELLSHDENVSTRTIQRRLRFLSCKFVVPRRVQKLTPTMMKNEGILRSSMCIGRKYFHHCRG